MEQQSKLEITASNIFRDPALVLAFGFGSGLAKKGPGTCGTLLAVPIYLALAQLSLFSYSLVVLISLLFGIWICELASQRLGVHDHGGIVWDEMVGLWITMLAVPLSIGAVIAGFILFRVFDIFKPWPISWLDKHVQGGFGIMVDDVAAAIAANLCLQLFLIGGLLV